ncbi:hypothetical protein, partial [Dorea formicigenerans]|uniref:hypothetical protein n=1 Tax=Dorea formicigenerans TaxID=39486 RepID=UPI001A9A2FFB
QKKSKLMQTKGQLMKSLNTAFSFAPPSILSLTICISVCFKNGQLRLELPTHCTNYAIFSCLHRFLHQMM